MTDEIIDVFGDIVHIYNNFSSFENVNIVNSISGYDFKKKYLELSSEEYASSHKRISPNQIELLPTELRTIIRYATILAFYGFGENWENNTYSNSITILRQIGVNASNPIIDELIKGFLKDIYYHGWKFFAVQSRDLKKELDKFPPYKIQQYISKLENIKRMEEDAYAYRTGKRINILSIKGNMCR